jgi:lantibiotic modifying enzyme
VLGQVRYADGPWIPTAAGSEDEPPWDRDGIHSGIGGLAFTLAEIREVRPWTSAEAELAEAITDRLTAQIPTMVDVSLFDGLVGAIAALIALDAPGAAAAVSRLSDLATPDGWAQTTITAPRYSDDARVSDVTLGTAAVLLGAVWASRHGIASADLANHAAAVLLEEAEEHETGLDWPFVPTRYLIEPPDVRMPNFSHGLTGIATALALAGAEFDRADLVEAAARGAERLIDLGDRSQSGFVAPRRLPFKQGEDAVTYGWCHGPTGTSLLFPALAAAGVNDVAGEPVEAWRRRCLTSVQDSGVPERRYPGFWDNDGRCCGTAGVGDIVLDAWHSTQDPALHDFGFVLADTLVDRAVRDGENVYWRFIEHSNAEPLLPPGVGWMQGTAGISAFLFRASRDGRAAPRIDNFWCVS